MYFIAQFFPTHSTFFHRLAKKNHYCSFCLSFYLHLYPTPKKEKTLSNSGGDASNRWLIQGYLLLLFRFVGFWFWRHCRRSTPALPPSVGNVDSSVWLCVVSACVHFDSEINNTHWFFNRDKTVFFFLALFLPFSPKKTARPAGQRCCQKKVEFLSLAILLFFPEVWQHNVYIYPQPHTAYTESTTPGKSKASHFDIMIVLLSRAHSMSFTEELFKISNYWRGHFCELIKTFLNSWLNNVRYTEIKF